MFRCYPDFGTFLKLCDAKSEWVLVEMLEMQEEASEVSHFGTAKDVVRSRRLL